MEFVVREVLVPRSRNWQVTDRDLTLLRWIGRWPGVTSSQVVRQFEGNSVFPSEQVVYRRLRALVAVGLLESGVLPGHRARAFWVTRRGLEIANIEGNPMSPNSKEYHHDLAVIDLAHQLQSAQPEYRLVTEREIRARDTPNQYTRPADPTYSVVAESGSGRRYPDLVTTSPDGVVWAHELERTRKPRPRLVRNMLAYVNADHIHFAMYWAWPDLLSNVEQAAAEANAKSLELGRGEKIAFRVWNVEGLKK
ncbi:hypothetical protein [Streptomyces sp. NRRL S-87]|uniref:hypothetical protein n=1 Tax=Streptomyces sp. NRRL S-87 TaxID=1463920 RepID=UPI00131D1A19|nr:hypothetical protein [Streptomyces sp. NRRL S-87]